MKVTGVLLAAGRGQRMGRTKQLVCFGPQTMLERCLETLLEVDLDEIVLVLGHRAEEIRAALKVEDPRLRVVVNPGWEEGMASSLRAGLEAASRDTEALLVALGDLPFLRPESVRRLLAGARASDRTIAVPVTGGRRGHPVLFRRCHFPAIRTLRGDRGGWSILESHPQEVLEVEVKDPGIHRDLDRPGDFLRLPPVVIRGAGDLGTGAAHRLSMAGFPVTLLELPRPRAIRRAASFAEAAYRGEWTVEGVTCRAVEAPPGEGADFLPLLVDPEGEWIRRLRPAVLVDARMLKRGGARLDQAPLVIGLGPGFEAGVDCHYVVETHRGHDLGRVIERGSALPDTGTPGTLGGESERRVVRAPAAGVFRPCCELGQRVAEGQVLGRVGDAEVRARLGGWLRGLMHGGVEVAAGEKVADVDPREGVAVERISDKARAVGGGVLEAVMRWCFGREGG